MLVFDICRSAICQCGVQSLSLASSGLRRHPMTCTPMAYWSRWVSPYRFCISKAALFRKWDCTKASTFTLRSASSTTTAWKRLTSLRHLRLSEASPQVRGKILIFPGTTQTISATLPSTRPYRTFCLHRMTCQSRRSLSEGTDPMLVRRKLIIIWPVISIDFRVQIQHRICILRLWDWDKNWQNLQDSPACGHFFSGISTLWFSWCSDVFFKMSLSNGFLSSQLESSHLHAECFSIVFAHHKTHRSSIVRIDKGADAFYNALPGFWEPCALCDDVPVESEGLSLHSNGENSQSLDSQEGM